MKSIFFSSTLALLLLSGCGEENSSEGQTLSELSLGEALFKDKSLSLNQNMSCATCHAPEHAFVDARFHLEGDNNPVHGALSVGSDDLSLGGRNAPTAAYAKFFPDFHYDDKKQEFIGGQFHDGRAKDLQEQAKGPFLDTAEMMMPSAEAVVDKVLENTEYEKSMKALYGDDLFNDKEVAYDKVAKAIATFEESEEFSTFTSRYDKFVEGNTSALNNDEREGMQLFFSNNNLNCVNCHQSESTPQAEHELFTNFSYRNIGTPQNLENLKVKFGEDVNASEHIDHGLFGRSDKDDFNITDKFDGFMKVPTLRNIAVTAPYMSNGVFKNLQSVLEFYDHMSGASAKHSNNPETEQPWRDAEVNSTINHKDLEIPDGMNDAKIWKLEAFLRALTDAKYEKFLPPFRDKPILPQ